jgi:glycerol-3-phosphate dehydrogenase
LNMSAKPLFIIVIVGGGIAGAGAAQIRVPA